MPPWVAWSMSTKISTMVWCNKREKRHNETKTATKSPPFIPSHRNSTKPIDSFASVAQTALFPQVLLACSFRGVRTEVMDCNFEKLPDHLIIEIFIRVPISEWVQLSCVKKQWAALFRGESLWHTALVRSWPSAGKTNRWPGPIPRGSSRRRYAALYASEHIVAIDGEIDELVGHVYLYLKEKLEHSTLYSLPGVLHATVIDQFITCGRSRDKANELASHIWLAVIDHLEENEHTFLLLKHLAQEEVFFPYPYSRSYRVQWRVFDKLFTDFRDCINHADYCDILGRAKNKFPSIPSTWLGY